MDRTATRGGAVPATIHAGIDVGSTTTKAVAVDPATGTVLHTSYNRHGARQVESVRDALAALGAHFPAARIRLALSGSGASDIAEALGLPFIQEVVAEAAAIRQLHPQARCAIELGGQDAKMVFFRRDEATGTLEVSDMRMNGSCAGGTGAFIDEIATLLKLPVEQFNAHAEQGRTVHPISGRCGVYAKTDIQPLLNQGASIDDLALSTFHAIAKQTIGGLAQGLKVEGPVVFAGGPLTFNPALVRVFAERLHLRDNEVILPESPETLVARGTAISLSGLFADRDADVDVARARASLGRMAQARTRTCSAACGSEGEAPAQESQPGDLPLAEQPLFATAEEKAAFEARHALPPEPGGVGRARQLADADGRVSVYLGVDSGSTTTKFAVLTKDGELLDSFYSSNEGDPLGVAHRALADLRDRYRASRLELCVAGCGTTGYGEDLFAHALRADYHTVETVAHAHAACQSVPDASFVLDIGGQDMKAIWVRNGVTGSIVVNEACSSGCGSFLETLAASLGISVGDIAEAAARSKSPAVLGSRCTVFMNSSIVSEQRNGKTPDDIVAGLARSIIENVFTKVVRVPNLDALGSRIVVQGGTFRNDAVLRALEQRVSRPVTRAPYPGLMGAIGVALLAKEHMEGVGEQRTAARPASTFIGFDSLDRLADVTQSSLPCPFCTNRCDRTVVTFNDGTSWVTGNRCERGLVVGDPKDAAVRERLRAARADEHRPANLFDERKRLLFQDWPVENPAPSRRTTIGIPRVLAFWDNAPFWTTFLRTLGFDVQLSSPSTRALYEDGLPAVASDTVCFPAKLVHGHMRDLARRGVDRIFMPIITAVPSENRQTTSESMCAVVKGYPMVVRSSEDPQETWGIPFDAPLFHWHSTADREKQLGAWMEHTFGIPAAETQRAIAAGDAAQTQFRTQLEQLGARAIADAQASGTYAVVLASRPYHNDPLVNHGLPRLIASLGHAVLPPDAVPGARDEDLSASRLDIVNNFHARMLSTALIAARHPALEYVQLVNFGCGHDAYLSDEITRLMREEANAAPLVLKVDETDAQGPLRIRTRSFLETIDLRRARAGESKAEGGRAGAASSEGGVVGGAASFAAPPARPLPDPYPVKFTKADRQAKVVLVPNTSHAFCRLMSAAFAKQGLRAEPLPMGGDEAIRLGKQYVHNDICFPAQIVIGEALAALESGKYDPRQVAIGTGKYIGDCRLTHYAALLRKALDDAGYGYVPIITNDDADDADLHPGFRMSVATAARIAMALPMIDALEELLRKMRPYELEPGASDRAFEAALDEVMEGLEHHGASGAKKGFRRGIEIMRQVRYDRSKPRPRVLIVGEYLLNFHPGANHHIEEYLESNGMEVVEARMTDVIRKTYFYQDAQVREFGVKKPLPEKAWLRTANALFEHAHDVTDRIAAAHPLYEPACRMPELVKASDPIMHHTFDAGEGVLIPGEVLHHAARGCRSFVILGPFGCLPNHVCGRGIAAQLKRRYPDATILALDYDPDVSFANIENRLQMLVMSAQDAKDAAPESDGQTDDGDNDTHDRPSKPKRAERKGRPSKLKERQRTPRVAACTEGAYHG